MEPRRQSSPYLVCVPALHPVRYIGSPLYLLTADLGYSQLTWGVKGIRIKYPREHTSWYSVTARDSTRTSGRYRLDTQPGAPKRAARVVEEKRKSGVIPATSCAHIGRGTRVCANRLRLVRR